MRDDTAAVLEPSPRVEAPPVFRDIASTSWEHPADRAALQALRAIPAVDQLLEKCLGFFGERGIRALFQGNAIRVGPAQLPAIHRLFEEAKATLDWHEEVELFVAQRPWFEAGAYGVERSFIVLNTTVVDALDEPELRVLLGHELGHIMSGHALYRTMLSLMLQLGVRRLPFMTGIALVPIQLSFSEWSRTSELSCDRAGLLVAHDRDDALKLLMKGAGGTVSGRHALNLDAYKAQIAECERLDGIDAAFKLWALLGETHPFHTLRAAELQRWGAGPEYAAILRGEYRRRSEEPAWVNPVSDLGGAVEYYADQAKSLAHGVASSTQKVAGQASTYARRVMGSALASVRSTAESMSARLEPKESDEAPKER
jgi:Zn-dependent protease with chaperone function